MNTVRRIVALFTLFALLSQQVVAAEWYVDYNADNDPDTCVADDFVEDSNCTFRDALSQASNGDYIYFTNSFTITNTGGTYTVAQNSLTIDGGDSVTFDGGSSGVDAFNITGDSVRLEDVFIIGGFDEGIVIDSGADGTTISSLSVGVESDGSTTNGVDGNGIEDYGTNSTHDSLTVGGNTGSGVVFNGASGFTFSNNTVGGSFSDLGNTSHAVVLDGVISGTNAITSNYIKYNGGDGLRITSTGAKSGTLNIMGNTIGDGFGAGNDGHGINGQANSSNSMDINLGDNGFANKNVISNSGQDGVHIENCGAFVMQNNFVGTDGAGGTTDYGNGGDGVEVGCATVVIGTNLDESDDESEYNLISANDGYGIYVNGSGVTSATIHGNFIGSNSQGGQNFTNFGNSLGGIEVNASALTSLTIGDPDGDAINRIIENGGGIRVQGTGTDATVVVKNNSIGVENETFQTSDQSVVGNNYTGGYMKGIVIDLVAGTADVTIGGVTSSDNGNEVAGHTSHGVEIGAGVKTATIAGNYIGVVEDYDASSDKYIVDGGNGGAGVYVDSSDTNMTAVTIGGGSTSDKNIIGANGAGGVHVADAGSGPADVTVRNNSIGIGQDDSTALGNTGDGVLIADGNTVVVSNNDITNSTSNAVRFTGGVGVTMNGNRIGNNATQTAHGNGGHGIHVNASTITSLVIGGSTSAAGNTIAASTGDGVYIQQLAASTTPVTIQGNIIGLCSHPVLGTMDTGSLSGCTNTGSGVDAVYGALTIGGDNAFGSGGDGNLEAGNVISNNTEEGIKLGASVGSASILGNAIGLARGSGSFTVDAGNGRDGSSDGVEVNSAAMTTLTIGGVGSVTASTKRNVISGNDGDGVDIIDLATGATVAFYNNYIGTNWAGDTAIANGGNGVKIADGTVSFGGTVANQGNTVAGNSGYGVYMTAGALSLLANNLGVAADGATALANTLNSVRVISTTGSVTSLTVGSSGAKNAINNDSVVGVYIRGVEPLNTTITDDNTWTDVVATTANYWERYTGSTLDAYAPGGESTGSGNYNAPSLSSSPLTPETTTTTTTATVEETEVTTEETTATTTEETTTTDVEETTEVVKETARPAEPVEGRATEEQVVESENNTQSTNQEVGAVREEAESSSIFRDRAEEPTRTFTANRDAVIRDFESEVLESQTTKEKLESFLDEAVDGELNELQEKDLNEGLEKVLQEEVERVLKLEPGKEVVVRGVNGAKKVVNKDTKVVFEPNYRNAVRLQGRADAGRENVIVVTSFTDLNGDKVADVLGVALVDEDKDGEDLAEKIFAKKVDLYEDPLLGRTEKSLVIGNLPGYGATVGKKAMIWVAGVGAGDNYEVVIINRDTLEETLIEKGELDEGRKAAVEVNFPGPGDYYIVVQGAFGRRDVVRVKVDDTMPEKVQEVEMLGDKPAKIVEKNDNLFASVMMAMGFEEEEAEVVGTDDRYVRGYTEPGSMVFVTWESVVLNSVVIADAGQGYFEVDVPDQLASGNHKVTVYNYNRKNQQFSGVLSQLFSR